jgi:membrane protease YdiL (CAAX protease family)
VGSVGASSGASGEPGRPASLRDRFTSLVEVVLCSGFPTQLLVTMALVALGLAVYSPDGLLSLRYIVVLSLVDTVLVVGLVLLFLQGRGERASSVFLGARAAAREIALGLLLLPAAFLLVIAAAHTIQAVAPWLRDPDGNPLARLLRTPADVALFAGVAVLAGGLREELQRAFVLHRFEQHLGGAAAGLVIFSALFGTGHAIQGWDAAILTGLLGAFWGLVYLWRRSVIAPLVCHALFNVVEVVYHGLTV